MRAGHTAYFSARQVSLLAQEDNLNGSWLLEWSSSLDAASFACFIDGFIDVQVRCGVGKLLIFDYDKER